jgi:hypothetical protein
MAIAHVQHGPVVVATTGTVVPTCSSSTLGNLLVAHLISVTGGTAFTAPANWVNANSATFGAGGRTELWYYPSCPSSITSASFTSGSSTVKGFISEWSGVATTSPLRTSGTANTGAGTCTASTAGSATAGDLGITCFGAFYSANTGITWTADSGHGGWTNLSNEAGSGSTRHNTGDYQLNLAAAVATETETSTVSPTSGWAAVIAAFMPPVVASTTAVITQTQRAQPARLKRRSYFITALPSIPPPSGPVSTSVQTWGIVG